MTLRERQALVELAILDLALIRADLKSVGVTGAEPHLARAINELIMESERLDLALEAQDEPREEVKA